MKRWETHNGYNIIRILSGRSNVFLLTDGKTNILVDTGPKFVWSILQRRLQKLKVEEIKLLILTHSHFDHAANACRIKKEYGCKVMIHSLEADYLLNGENIVPSGTNPVTGIMVKLLANRMLSVARYQPCTFDYAPESSFDLAEFGFNAAVIHTPGHTGGSMSIIVDNEIALVGDTMFGFFGWTNYPPFAVDPVQLVKSWGILVKTGCNVFLPSHGSAKTRAQVIKNFNKRKAHITI
jgi:glyoxylase-like metal-dependent hydrolase (beta-lactamase superfamily II)